MTNPVYELALNHPKLTRESERELLTKYARLRTKHGATHRKTIAVRNTVVRAFLRLVAKIAKRYRGMSQEDLLGYGVAGLITACERFDVTRGYRFGTYATPWVRHELGRACENLVCAVRVPVGEQLKHRRGARDKWEGVQILGSYFSLDEVLLYGGGLGGHDRTTHDVMADEACESADTQLCRHHAAVSVRKVLLKTLTAREVEILERRYLADETETLSEVGARLNGISRERVRQLEVKALAKMRDAMWAQGMTREAV